MHLSLATEERIFLIAYLNATELVKRLGLTLCPPVINSLRGISGYSITISVNLLYTVITVQLKTSICTGGTEETFRFRISIKSYLISITFS